MPDPNDVSQMARDLAMSEPLMVLGKLAAEGGQHVQDAYDTIKQHLSDLGTKAEQVVESGATTLKKAATSAGSAVSSAAGKVADAIVPKLKAEEQMPTSGQLLSSDPEAPVKSGQLLSSDPGAAHPMNFAVVNGQRVPVDDPNTIGTFAAHVGAQINPVSAVKGMGQAILHPVETAKNIGAAQVVPLQKAQASYQAGDYATAARHFIDYLIPLAGPVLDTAADRAQKGQIAAGAGDAVGLGLSLFGPQALATKAASSGFNTPRFVNPNPADTAAVQFGQARGVPLDAATATGNSAVRGVQWLADRSLAGSVVGGRAKQAQSAGLARVGGELADVAHPSAMTAEQAGTNVAGALEQKVAGLSRQADTAYGTVRAIEAKPENAIPVPKAPVPVDQIDPVVVGQVRRIVHELDAMPYTKRLLQPTKHGGSLEHVEGTGGAGAGVFDDIVGRLEAGSPTRAVVQQQLEQYLGGGKETPIVKAALDVAGERRLGRGGQTVGKPELPPSAMDTPTALEGLRDTHEPMQLPVHLVETKAAIQPLVDQLRRQLPITQQQANPGLKALQNVLDGPDWAPLSQVDRDLSAIKTLARERGGLAKIAVQKLGAAVNQAAADAGPDVARALSQGRAATVAKYSAQEVLEKLKAEPVATIKALTANGDASIQRLRAVVREVPQMAPQIARAKLDDLLSLATERGGFDHADKLYADWNKLGAQTKQILFPKPGQVQDLDRFFLLAKKIAENPNPSGSGHTASLVAQLGAIQYDPLHAIVTELGAAGLSSLLHSQMGVRLLTQGLTLRIARAPAAAQAASTARILATAREMGLTAAGATAAGPGSTPATPGATAP